MRRRRRRQQERNACDGCYHAAPHEALPQSESSELEILLKLIEYLLRNGCGSHTSFVRTSRRSGAGGPEDRGTSVSRGAGTRENNRDLIFPERSRSASPRPSWTDMTRYSARIAKRKIAVAAVLETPGASIRRRAVRRLECLHGLDRAAGLPPDAPPHSPSERSGAPAARRRIPRRPGAAPKRAISTQTSLALVLTPRRSPSPSRSSAENSLRMREIRSCQAFTNRSHNSPTLRSHRFGKRQERHWTEAFASPLPAETRRDSGRGNTSLMACSIRLVIDGRDCATGRRRNGAVAAQAAHGAAAEEHDGQRGRSCDALEL